MSASVPHRLKPTRLFCPWMGFYGKEHWSGLPLPSPGDRASLIAQLVRFWFDPWVRKIPWRRDRLPTPVLLGFPCGSAGEESAHNAEDLGSIPGLQRSPREGKGYPLQYSALENAMDYVVRGFSKSQTRLSDFHFHFLRGLFPAQGSNLGLLHCRQILYCLRHQGSPTERPRHTKWEEALGFS